MNFTFNGHIFNSDVRLIKGIDLKLMRVQAGKTTMEAAEAIGVKSRKTIENWEAERCEPTIETFIQLACIYGFDPSLVVQAGIQRAMSELLDDKMNIDLEACLL